MQYLYELGKQRLEQNNLVEKRIICNMKTYYPEEYLDTLDHKQLINKLENILDINFKFGSQQYNTVWKYKENHENFQMKWHCDDCFIHKHKKLHYSDVTEEFSKKNIILDKECKYTLTHSSTLPIYTALIYLSDYNKDYTGGELEFVDMKVKPNRYDVIVFDSREIHRVNIQKSGIRKNLIVKYYLL